MKLSANNIVLKALGLLLLTAAVLKGHELLTTPMANADIWSNRNFMIFQVEFELALGIWLLSGLFKRASWLVTLGCFALFCGVTLYKALAGFGSCGCFGNVHVNPWITLFAVDLPAVVLLAIFRPKFEIQRILHIPHWLEPLPKLSVMALVFMIGLSAVAVNSLVLILNEPTMVTAEYEVLEPATWIGKELPILEHIDIGEQLKTGNWLVVLYHHDCPSCADAIPKIENMARDLEGNEDFLQFAFVEMPPHGLTGNNLVGRDSSCVHGKIDAVKEWLVATPVFLILSDKIAVNTWQESTPVFEEIVKYLLISEKYVTSGATLCHNKKGGDV